jgi:hypothetical protein
MKNKTYILSFNPLIIKYIFVLNMLISIGTLSMAQKSFKGGLNGGAKIGTSKLLTEITSGFSETINEFDNKAGIAYSLEVSKYLSTRWEIGLEWNFSNLKGNALTPEFSAEGVQEGIPAEITEPVEYSNHLSGPNFLFRYYFKPVTKDTYFNPFIRAGVGILHYKSTLEYINSGETIFGTEKCGTNLNTPAFNLGTGFKSSISSRFYLVTSIDFNLVNYDYLDVMHNFDQEGNRLKLYGLYAEFKVGIFYNMVRTKKVKSTSSKYSLSEFLPFARR